MRGRSERTAIDSDATTYDSDSPYFHRPAHYPATHTSTGPLISPPSPAFPKKAPTSPPPDRGDSPYFHRPAHYPATLCLKQRLLASARNGECKASSPPGKLTFSHLIQERLATGGCAQQLIICDVLDRQKRYGMTGAHQSNGRRLHILAQRIMPLHKGAQRSRCAVPAIG